MYGLIRQVLRVWFALSRQTVRLLGSDRLPGSAAILRVCRAARFSDALVLIAAMERPLACVIDRRDLRSWESLLASGLNVIPFGAGASEWQVAVRACTKVLDSGGVALVLEDSGTHQAGHTRSPSSLTLAQEAWAGAFPEQAAVIIPVHCFRTAARDQEIVVHMGERMDSGAREDARAALEPGPDATARAGCGGNVFALQPAVLQRLLDDLEHVLRDRLRAEWASRSVQKQTVDGFRLSSVAAQAIRRINQTHPEDLAALQQLYGAERNACRRWSLSQIRAELGRQQLSRVQRLLGWAESFAGLPIACYGAINHAIAITALFLSGLTKFDRQEPASRWLGRAVIVLGSYAVQVILIDRVFGRAVAGYYAASLPVSGAYLWRYSWLLRQRTRILLLGLRSASLRAPAEKNRQRFVEKLETLLGKT